MDSSHNTDTGDTSAPSPPRIQLVTTAVSFLQNPNVARSSIVQKEQFLRSKGLTDEEIKMAFQQAGIFTKDPNNTIINMEIGHRAMQQQLYPAPETTLQRIYNLISSTALVTGIFFSIYYVYKRFIEPFLFGRKKDRKSTDEIIKELDKKIDKNMRELTVELRSVKDEFHSSFSGNHMLRHDVLSFKNDLDAIKGLLLSRKQFTSPPVPQSIPAWQLQSQRSIGVGDANTHADADKNDDNGSADGSRGSSETEVVTKHSDSSLELIS